jgi:twitching motility protein PilT
LVFSTLHTLNAAKTIDRIINSFPAEEQNQIALSLKTSFAGSISQLLVKTKEG